MVQNDKKLCPARSISQETYITWYIIYGANVYNDDISRCFFFILKFWLSRLSRGWKGKKWPKMTKISVCRTLYFRNHISYDLHLWYTCMYKRIISPSIFLFLFFLLKILIFEIIRGGGEVGKMAKNHPKWQKILSVSFCISGTIHLILWFLVHMCKMMISANVLIFQNFNFGVF